MKRIAIVVALLALGGCGVSNEPAKPDISAIVACAKQHEPPPQANVERLGLLPVYYTRTVGSDDAETQKWFADMDACLGKSAPPGK